MKKLNDMEKKASSKVLGDLRSHAQKMMNDKMKGLKKVTVASDSKEGLSKGLETAEKILKGKSPLEEESEESEIETPELEENEEEELEESSDEPSEMSEEEIDAKLKELMQLKESFKNK